MHFLADCLRDYLFGANLLVSLTLWAFGKDALAIKLTFATLFVLIFFADHNWPEFGSY